VAGPSVWLHPAGWRSAGTLRWAAWSLRTELAYGGAALGNHVNDAVARVFLQPSLARLHAGRPAQFVLAALLQADVGPDDDLDLVAVKNGEANKQN